MRKRLACIVLVAVTVLCLLPTAVFAASGHDSSGYDSSDYYFDWKGTAVEVDASTGKLSKITSNAWYTGGNLDGRHYGFFLIEAGKDTVRSIGTSSYGKGIDVEKSSAECQSLLNNGVDIYVGTLSGSGNSWIPCTIPASKLTSCSIDKDYHIYIYTLSQNDTRISFESCMGTLTKVTVNQYTFSCKVPNGQKVATVNSMGVIGVAYNPTALKYSGLSYDATKTGTLSAVSSSNKTFNVYYKVTDHDWEYSASGNTLTATCKYSSCAKHTTPDKVTITATGKTYNGTPVSVATLSSTTLGGLTVSASNIKYSGTGSTTYASSATPPTNVGTYAASITAGGLTATSTFSITPATMTLTAPSTVTFTYDTTAHGSAATPSITGATVTYSVDGGATYTSTVPQITNAGSLSVKAKATKDNYYDATCSYTLTVNQASPTLTAPSVVEFLYSGSAQGNPAVPSISFAPVQYSVDGGAYTTAVPQLTDVGSVSVKAKIDDPNFTAASCEYTLKVKARQVTLTSASSVKTYDGTALTNQAVSVSGDGFATGESFAFDCAGTQTDVGCASNHFTYTLTNGAKEGNYEITVEYGMLTVNPKDGTNLQPDTEALKDLTELLQADNPDSTVNVYMIIKREVPHNDKVALYRYTKNKQAIYYKANLYADIDGVTYDMGDENEFLITVTSNLTFEDRENFAVYRLHNGSVDKLTETPNDDGEYFELDTENNKVLVTAKKYSTYAIVYEGKSPKTGDDDNLYIFSAMALATGIGLCALAVIKRKKKEN